MHSNRSSATAQNSIKFSTVMTKLENNSYLKLKRHPSHVFTGSYSVSIARISEKIDSAIRTAQCMFPAIMIILGQPSPMSGSLVVCSSVTLTSHTSPGIFIWLAVHSSTLAEFCSDGLRVELLIWRKPFPAPNIRWPNKHYVVMSTRHILRSQHHERNGRQSRYIKSITKTIQCAIIMTHTNGVC